MPVARIPKPVQVAMVHKWPLYWVYMYPGFQARTVLSGYALYARTGQHENGRIIERKLYTAATEERARDLAAAVDEQLGSKRLSRELEQLLLDLEF